MKQQSQLPLNPVPLSDREVGDQYFEEYDFPTRPKWRYDMTKEELNMNENRYFREYLEKLEKIYIDGNKPFSVFELNLETWRQLWRVVEMCDIILTIVDIRYSALLFPPSLYNFIVKNTHKSIIVILNKIDLVSPEVAAAWKEYFLSNFSKLSVIYFTSNSINRTKNNSIKRKQWSTKVQAKCAYSIFNECKKIVGNDIDLTKWEQKILEDSADNTQVSSNDCCQSNASQMYHEEKETFDFEERPKYKDGILTIGCVGFPNVGKSSVINALKGRKVVSVSRTPGHTKYFQTIFLCSNVKLCDCPGLVFPSSVPKYIQVIMGSYPIAQLREPYSSIKYVAERINLPKYLNLLLPENCTEWSAMAICEAFAIKKSFLTKKSRPDYYRAANYILRMILNGKIILEFFPPDYFKTLEKWKNHRDIEDIKELQFESPLINPNDISKTTSSNTSSEDEAEGTHSSENSDNDEDEINGGGNAFEILGEE